MNQLTKFLHERGAKPGDLLVTDKSWRRRQKMLIGECELCGTERSLTVLRFICLCGECREMFSALAGVELEKSTPTPEHER